MADELKGIQEAEEELEEKTEELEEKAEELGELTEKIEEAEELEEEANEAPEAAPEGAALPESTDEVADTKELLAWAQKAGSKMTGGNPAKANKLKADKIAIYQVDCSVILDEKKFYEVSMWNMFSRKKIFVILMAIIYGLALITIGGAIPRLKNGDTNGFILNGGMGFIMLVLFVYMLYSQVNRFKRISKNEEFLKKTAKHFRFTRELITNYRVEAQEERKYEWDQVSGVYDRPEEIIIATKKDEQLLVVEKNRLNEREMGFLRDIIDEKKLWKRSMPKATAYGIFIAITAGGALFILQAIFR